MKKTIQRLLILTSMALIVFISSARAIEVYSSDIPVATFSKSDLINLIATQKVASVEQLLALLPDSLKYRAVLVFNSRSLQAGSFSRPRVILFNEDASLVLTFNGDVSQYGYETLEVMSFDHQKNKFEFEEVLMPEDFRKREEYLESQSLVQEINALKSREARTGVNPATCLACHRQNPRPNWESYPLWPGVYGQRSHTFPIEYLQTLEDSQSLTPARRYVKTDDDARMQQKKKESHPEVTQFKEFLISASTHPRYSKLSYLKHAKDISDYPDKNNLRFSFLISSLNFKRLGVDILCHPDYQSFAKLWPAFSKATGLDARESDNQEVQQAITKLGFSSEILSPLANAIMKLQTESDLANLKLILDNVPDPEVNSSDTRESFGAMYEVAQLQYILKNALGIELSDYEMTFQHKTYNFSNGNFGIGEFRTIFKNLSYTHKCAKP